MEPLFILGASDPEMARIERHLAGRHRYAYAMRDGSRVHPGNAYRAETFHDVLSDACLALPFNAPYHLVFVECRLEGLALDDYTVVDHHRDGDPGFGMPPERFLEGSSLGQVLALLGVDPSPEDRLVAAADHCPGAAYQGLCPGVRPVDLADYRTRERLAWIQSRPESAPERRALLGDLSVRGLNRIYDQTAARVRSAATLALGGYPVKDVRPYGTLSELPEVLARIGVCALYRVVPAAGSRDPRCKVGIIGGGLGSAPGREPVDAFLAEAADRFGLCDLYGDPVRGYAGGYERPLEGRC